FKTVFTTPVAAMLTIGFSGLIFVITAYMTWMPAYLQEEFGQSQAAAGFNSMFWTYVAAFAGVLLAGSLSDRLSLRNRKARMLLQAAGLILGAVPLFVIGECNVLWVLYLCFALWGFFRAFFDANTYSVLYDVTPSRLHASCSSAMITTGFAVGALAPLILGAMKQSLGSLRATFPVLGVIWLLCGLMMASVALRCYQKDYDRNITEEKI
ncbi:MAG: MFS transporter, partial [Candidatus Cryptobacteroides sp.]